MTPREWSPELLERFAPIAARNPWGALETHGEQLHGAYVFQLDAGAQSALAAVRPVLCTHGVRAEVVGMVSEAPLFQFAAIDRGLMRVATMLNADVLAMSTQLPGLVRGAQRVGWVTTGAIVTKKLGH
ncbi:hypothetical protein [Hydrogenophaga intermedia]|uniref:hypothetical protein n=1 Tax=Hydrogenophaga intermedia TaxID=65786 RepID=UPI002044967C|nr:hypothetical protein [Hydrogenophaga intermedia]MCM3565927.1 hypothetical protein [Hydrogenophaga intermedia]